MSPIQSPTTPFKQDNLKIEPIKVNKVEIMPSNEQKIEKRERSNSFTSSSISSENLNETKR